MEVEYDSLLHAFVHQSLIRRTSQNNVEFAPLEERGLVQQTLSGCWLLTAAGRRELNGGAGPITAAKSVPPIFAPESNDSPGR